jgi:hypothetical protein
MTDRRERIAFVGLWASGVVNVGAVVAALIRHDYGSAGAQSVLVALIAAWGWLVPKISATLDAKLGEAIAQQRMGEMAADAMRRQMDTFGVQVGVNVSGHVDRKH